MARDSIQFLHLEEEGVRHDVLETFEAAARAARRLEYAGGGAHEAATVDAFGDDDAKALDERAERLRGAALHALTLAVELAAQAGRLEQLASIRRGALTGSQSD